MILGVVVQIKTLERFDLQMLHNFLKTRPLPKSLKLSGKKCGIQKKTLAS